MVSGPSEKLANRQHFLLATLSIWLIITSPWLSLVRRLPRDGGWLDYAHVVVGVVALLLTLTYTFTCLRTAGWRTYFPWAGDAWRVVVRDLRGLVKGRIPPAEGGGLFAAVEGLVLISLLATGLTGAGWLWSQGTADALSWRDHHIVAARVLTGVLVLHVITVSLHLLDLLRD